MTVWDKDALSAPHSEREMGQIEGDGFITIRDSWPAPDEADAPVSAVPAEGVLDGLLETWAGLTESAEVDFEEDMLEAQTTGERPDLWAYKLEIGLDDARDLIGFLTALRAQQPAPAGEAPAVMEERQFNDGAFVRKSEALALIDRHRADVVRMNTDRLLAMARAEKAEASLVVARNAQIERGDVFVDSNPEARWLEDSENACPACGGSGHKDDAAPAEGEAKPVAWQKPSTAEMARRKAIQSSHEQMADAQSQCVPCRLCGAMPAITDAGLGWGYTIACPNSYRPSDDRCLQSGARISGWAYNASGLWNRLNTHPPAPQPVAVEADAPDWKAFGKAICGEWPGSEEPDGGDVFDLAVKHRIILPVPGGFDPEEHDDESGFAQPGDAWYVWNRAHVATPAAQVTGGVEVKPLEVPAWRVFESTFRGYWGIEIDGDAGNVLDPVLIDREVLDAVVSAHNAPHIRAETTPEQAVGMAAINACLVQLDMLVAESGRGVEWGEEDAFRMGEWFEKSDLANIEAAKAFVTGYFRAALTGGSAQ